MGKLLKTNILYSDLAEWWPLLSDPAEYAEESAIYRGVLLSHCRTKPTRMLELGSGGGNNACHLKKDFKLTLVDLSPQMLEVSRKLNPECIHIQGDMKKLRLRQVFDVVFIHDAINYMITRDQLRQAITTAFVHCRPGGVALFVPDWTAENFRPSTSHGGHDKGEKGLRYLEWTIDHDPNDDLYTVYMTYLLKEGRTITQSAVDEHVCGLFPERDWLKIIEEAGFKSKKLPYDHSEFEKGTHFMFVGIKPEKRGKPNIGMEPTP